MEVQVRKRERNQKQVLLFGGILIAFLFMTGTVAALEDNSSGGMRESISQEDIAPYQGPISADSPLYGLKIAMEDLDETFTFNETERVEKQVDHAQLRIAEVRKELSLNRTNASERALGLYWQKLNLTERSLAPFASNTTGLLHAQEMIARHQAILANLSRQYPNNTGLAGAYHNSLLLEQKFEQKTEMRLTRFIEKDNKTIFKALRLGIRTQELPADENSTSVETGKKDKDKIRDTIKDQKDKIPVNETRMQQNENRNTTPPVNEKPQEDKGSSQDKNQKSGRD
jgi:hypothetical protein